MGGYRSRYHRFASSLVGIGARGGLLKGLSYLILMKAGIWRI